MLNELHLIALLAALMTGFVYAALVISFHLNMWPLWEGIL